jgi:hypothetical protein
LQRFHAGNYCVVRIMFWSYLVLLVVGIVVYTIVGAGHH